MLELLIPGNLTLKTTHSPTALLLTQFMAFLRFKLGEVPQRSCSWMGFTDPALFLVSCWLI